MYLLWNLYTDNVELLRRDLKLLEIIPTDERYRKQADIINTVFPLMVDRMSDEELLQLLEAVMQKQSQDGDN